MAISAFLLMENRTSKYHVTWIFATMIAGAGKTDENDFEEIVLNIKGGGCISVFYNYVYFLLEIRFVATLNLVLAKS